MVSKQTVGSVVAGIAMIGVAVAGYYFTSRPDQATTAKPTSTPSASATSKPTPTGLSTSKDSFAQYQKYAQETNALLSDVVEGTGDPVVVGDKVAMLYKGWLTDGTMFDQSRPNEAGQLQPFVFEIGAGQVIRGWDQGIVGMKKGGKRRLIIPPAVGYGATGQGSIPGNAVLIFDVELVAIQKQQ
jgi:FKBP-type peptidyl-prolyl cis-trans isomerase